MGNEGNIEGESKVDSALKRQQTPQFNKIKKKSQGPMAEVGKVVTGWVKYMGTMPDKIVLLVRGEAMHDPRRCG